MASLAEVAPRLLYTGCGHRLMIRPMEGEDTEALYRQICSQFENNQIEQDREGNISIMPPVGGESSDQNSEITMQLRSWAKRDGLGRALDSSVGFSLPDRSKLSPDAAWVHKEKLAALTRKERRTFLQVVPDFVIELKSPSDRLSELQKKMHDWKQNGVGLGWLIHPDRRLVFLYRQGQEEPENFFGNHACSRRHSGRIYS